MKHTKLAVSDVAVNNFRSLDEIQRVVDQIENEVNDSGKLLKKHRQEFASYVKANGISFKINFDPTRKTQPSKDVKKNDIDVGDVKKVTIPNVTKLKNQYALVEDLHSKYRVLESLETQIQMNFKSKADSETALEGIRAVKAKVSDQLSECFAFLNTIATKHVPKEFETYMEAIAAKVSQQIHFEDDQVFLYVSVDPAGRIQFSYYIMLKNVLNESGEVYPSLYLVVSWVLKLHAKDAGAGVFVNLLHEFEVPGSLDRGTSVSSVSEAIKAITHMFELENLSTELGVLPLKFNVKDFKDRQFSYQQFIERVDVNDDSMDFVLRQSSRLDDKTINTIASQLYLEVQSLLKKSRATLRVKRVKKGSKIILRYTMTSVAGPLDVSLHDAEFLKDRFGLTHNQLRKVVDIINNK